MEAVVDCLADGFGEGLPDVAPRQLVPRPPKHLLSPVVDVGEAPVAIDRVEGIGDALQGRAQLLGQQLGLFSGPA